MAGAAGEGDEGAEGGDGNAAPTTRSKTAPLRQPSPSPAPNPAIKRGVMTLADIHAAHAVLAEKANQHWAKGLGGGQNREGETIVNFLYKNKVGHSEFLLLDMSLSQTVCFAFTTRPRLHSSSPVAVLPSGISLPNLSDTQSHVLISLTRRYPSGDNSRLSRCCTPVVTVFLYALRSQRVQCGLSLLDADTLDICGAPNDD